MQKIESTVIIFWLIHVCEEVITKMSVAKNQNQIMTTQDIYYTPKRRFQLI